jgi:hypothetical protein
MTWQTSKDGFIEADVIRWSEPIWKPRRSKKAKAIKIGTRQITAEVLKDEEGWVQLLVLESILTEDDSMRSIPPLKKHTEIKRKRPALENRNTERLLWSDESVRASLVEHPVQTLPTSKIFYKEIQLCNQS